MLHLNPTLGVSPFPSISSSPAYFGGISFFFFFPPACYCTQPKILLLWYPVNKTTLAPTKFSVYFSYFVSFPFSATPLCCIDAPCIFLLQSFLFALCPFPTSETWWSKAPNKPWSRLLDQSKVHACSLFFLISLLSFTKIISHLLGFLLLSFVSIISW